jgi:ABC-type phosphate transport system ATPase subunit
LVVCAALQEPDVLLLDEPTNHLDLDAIEWLEGYLRQQVGVGQGLRHSRAMGQAWGDWHIYLKSCIDPACA